MTKWTAKRKGLKPSGGKYWPYRKKRLSELGSDPTLPKVGKLVKRQRRVKGGGSITQIVTADVANLLIDGKYKKTKIKYVKENAANRHFVRMNVLTKGTIIETEDGLAKVTGKPSRSGAVNAILVKPSGTSSAGSR
ncbi:MAG TPA: 30S ribosomal protein S8e [Candidatus Nanoarchaeia archaeon]|nr:30S ribosomal protein S8e [Candidatus Nanoarchaeia archaeon]